MYGKLLLHGDVMLKKEKQGGDEEGSNIEQILQSAWIRRHALLFERMIVFCSVEAGPTPNDLKIYKFIEEFPLNKVVVHDENTEEDVQDDENDSDDETSSGEELCWSLSVEHLGNKFAYSLKHQDRGEKRRWYETAYALNQRLKPLFFKRILYRKMLTLIFAEPKLLGELVIRINKSMVSQSINHPMFFSSTKSFLFYFITITAPAAGQLGY